MKRFLSVKRCYSTQQTLVEKIVQRFVEDSSQLIKSGQYVSIRPQHVMTHDNTSAVMKKFNSFPFEKKIFNNNQPVFTLDHDIQNKSDDNLKKYSKIEQFAKQHAINFYPAGRGIGHQVMVEEGYAFPLSMVVASDSHSNMYGGVACLGTPIVRTDAASIWATGKTWWQVPPITKVELVGKLPRGVTGKDVIITLCGLFNKDEVLNHAVEFTGEGLRHLSVEDRLTIANMTTEWGTLVGLFPLDDVLLQWMKQRAEKFQNKHPRYTLQRIKELEQNVVEADKDAFYVQHLVLDLSTVRPHVSGPNHVKTMKSVAEMEKQKVAIQKAYIVSCVNSRLNDLHEAAQVFKEANSKVNPNVQLYIAAASSEVQKESEALGDWKVLVDAGAKVLPPGCGPCIGLGTGLLEDNEVGISATNRNFKGRMGSSKAQAYLGSPSVVAASAIKGYICSPVAEDQVQETVAKRTLHTNASSANSSTSSVSLIKGFPEYIRGRVVYCYQDNLNTDGIYPGKYTYSENISPEEQAKVAMENYDPEFQAKVQQGDVLIGGYNFGTGSSREQAATALKYRGIPLIIAGSFSETYKRNATNNGYLTIELPQLVEDLKKEFGTKELTKVTSYQVQVDFVRSVVTLQMDGKENVSYVMNPVGKVAQELILLGGLENWIIHQVQQQQK